MFAESSDSEEVLARLGEALIASGAIDAAALRRGERVAAETGERLDAVLVRLGIVEERAVAEALARELGLPMVAAADLPDEAPFVDALNAKFVRNSRFIPMEDADGSAVLAMVDPLDEAVRAAVALRLGRPTRRAVALSADVENALERLYGEGRAETAEDDAPADSDTAEDVARLRDMASEAPVIRLVAAMLRRAAEQRASDIHLEPFAQRLRVRYRVDGVLREIDPPPAHLRAAVISRIKIMARLNIAETRLPQDGRTRITVAGRDIDLRVATIPTLHGESVVMRLLDRGGLTLDFRGLGFDDAAIDALTPLIEKPHGIFLVTGPTGSGKTTTLYAALTRLNRTGVKIMTVEDPVEYQLEGVVQSQVKSEIGFTFADALRSILRHNPNIIMIGEIRDLETARIAVRAALTGHLVIATLHTNSAAAAINRLRDMGVEDYLITATLVGAAAQRLVRRLCPDCAAPDPAQAALARRLGAGEGRFLGPVGCAICAGVGYRGRTTLIEVLPMDDALRRLALKGADLRDLEDAAVAAGMRTMRAHGLERTRAGETSADEIVSVVAGI